MHEVLQVRQLCNIVNILLISLLSHTQETRDAQATFSSESTPTVWKTIPTLKCLQENWKTLAKTPKFARVRHGIEKGLAKLKKWYMATDQTNMYFICLGMPSLILVGYHLTSHYQLSNHPLNSSTQSKNGVKSAMTRV